MVARNDENFALPADLADAIRQRVGINGFANATEVLRAAMALLNSSAAASPAELDAMIAIGIKQADAGDVVPASEVLQRWRSRDASHGGADA